MEPTNKNSEIDNLLTVFASKSRVEVLKQVPVCFVRRLI
jgi:hypothetical protein